MNRALVGELRLLPCLALALTLYAATLTAAAESVDELDVDRFRALMRRDLQGEALSVADAAYLEKYDKLRKVMVKKRQGQDLNDEERALLRSVRERTPHSSELKPQPSTGLIPLGDQAATGSKAYPGEDGGLYGKGANELPAALQAAAQLALADIRPRDIRGKPSAKGKVVLLSVGMSNTTQEFSTFKRLADADAEKSPNLVIVDGAQGGKDAPKWSGLDQALAAQAVEVWKNVDQRLDQQGVSARQVQVLWIKQALARPAQYGAFPGHARELQRHLAGILKQARARFPHLVLAFLSSRTYAGYSNGPLNPEPYAYESAFAVRWLIQEQLAEEAPLLLWGPYLWSDGIKARKGDGLVWQRDDFGPDGTHPSELGRNKVAALLLDFFKSDASAKPWFVASDRP